MNTPAELYVNGIKKKLKNYWAAWLPNNRFHLGDVGVLDGKFFTKVSSLESLGVRFDVEDDRDPSPIDYVSETGVSIFFKLAGEVNTNLQNIPEATAGIAIEFSSQGGFVVQASETYEPSIKDIVSLQNQIIPAFKDGLWDKSWTVIVRIVEAPVGTFLISNSSESKVELSAEGDLSSGLAELGKSGAKLSVRSQKGDVLKILGAQNVSPFFQLARIKKKFIGLPILSTKSYTDINEPLNLISPQIARDNTEISDSLYLDLVLD